MTESNKSSSYTDITWSSKTLNLSISRFFSAIKTGLGGSSDLKDTRFTRTKTITQPPLLTWDHFRDHLNLIDSVSTREKEEKEQYRLLKETILSMKQNVPSEGTTVLQPIPTENLSAPIDNNKRLIVPKRRSKRVHSEFMQQLERRLVDDFRREFYRVPRPFYIDLPHIKKKDDDKISSSLISMSIRKLREIPPWVQYKRTVPNEEFDLFGVYRDLEKRVIEFQHGYEDARINFLAVCEFVRTKQLNSRVFIKQCQRLSEETQVLRERLGQFHIETYDNFFSAAPSPDESSTIVVTQRNFSILMEMLFDLQRASSLCEEKLTLCSASIIRIRNTLVSGEDTFRTFQSVHARYVRYDTFLEKYFWKLWWHFDLIQQELFGGGVTEALEKHQEVLDQSIIETQDGQQMLTVAEPKLRGISLLLVQIERMHGARSTVQSLHQYLASQ